MSTYVKEKEYSISELEVLLEMTKLKKDIEALESSLHRSTPVTTSRAPVLPQPDFSAIASANPPSTNSGLHPRAPVLPQPDFSVIASANPPSTNSGMNPTAAAWSPSPMQSTLSFLQQQIACQQEAYTSMASAVRESFSMPKPEILSFNGDPKEYYRFMSCFEANIERRVEDDGMKLNYLIQFCKGESRDAIKDCSIMSPGEGYNRAKGILQKRYGQPHTIVRALVQELVSGPGVRSNDGEALDKLAAQMKRCELTLSQMGYVSDMNNFETIIKIARRLPQHLRAKWVEKADQIIERGSEPTFHDLSVFIDNRARVANTLYGQSLLEPQKESHSQNYSAKPTSKKRATTLVTQGDTLKKPTISHKDQCWLCKQNHNLVDCQQFRSMSFDERRKVTRDNGLCDNCLRRGHRSKQCVVRSQCTVEGCTWKHVALLHPPTAPMQPTASVQSTAPVQPAPTTIKSDEKVPDPSEKPAVTFMTSQGEDKVFLRIVPVKVQGRNGTIETYALLDDCSDISLCDKRLIDQLGIEGTEKCFQITTVSDQACSRKGREVSLTVSAMDDSEQVDLERVWSVDKIPVDQQCIPTAADLKKYPHLEDIEFPMIEKSKVTILIGSDSPEAFWQNDERRGKRKEPYAIKSPLGWAIIGPTGPRENNAGTVNFTQRSDNMLHEQLEQLWKCDFNENSRGKSMSVEDRRALKMFEESAVKEKGHFQVSLPWRRNPPDLTNNRSLAESRLRHLKRRLKGDVSLYASYRSVMEGYISKGHARKAPSCRPDEVTWYLPHHPVIHPKKQKLRIVFDCAARYEGKSLNDELLQGPDLMNSLVGVLHRFRQKPVAVSGDVEAMFHQVRVTPSDCSALRFLWWSENLDEEPEDYQMLVHLFGATSSPSVCCWALRQTAVQNGEAYDDKVLAAVNRNFYVDDCLVSVDTEEEAKELIRNLTNLMQSGGFRLTKWMSNSREVMSSIPEDERAKSVVNLDLEELPVERALGMIWNVENDSFQFTSALKEKPATKRGLLSVISSLYDPLGFVAPVTLTAKKLLQELCRQKVGWDEPIGEVIATEWNEWLRNLDIISKISIERCFVPKEFGKVSAAELHIFADASESGYGSVAYLRLINSKQQVYCAFVMGKSRLAPIKSVTIPRLELSAAVVATRLKTLLEHELDIEIKRTTLWTDSTSVLQYIRNENRRFKTFVANRLSEIQESSQPSQWRYVNTNRNPADIASRGLKTSDSERLQVWLEGPEFLKEDEEKWPQNPENLPELDPSEVKRTVIFTEGETVMIEELIRRYSSWHKLQKAVAWILRFKQYCVSRWIERNTEALPKGSITVEELYRSEAAIIQYVQQRSLKKKDLKKLNPVTKDGLMRVGGRLDRAPIEFEAKHPIILPSSHHITTLIVRHHHEDVGHSGCDFVLSSVRQRFWIVKGRAAVKREIGQCMICRKRSAPRGEQFMAPLPASRTTPDKPPFSYTGVDYFGPLLVKQGRSTVKRYGCLFTCMTTRAVHIEVAYSLDSDSFLGALQRFISRRGKPEMITSDNGTNFKGGEKELRQAMEQWNKSKINNALLQQKIEWSFNPPGASHMGGVWERMIRTTRRILKVLANEQLLKDEALLTLMAEAEKIINDRPLTTPSSDPNDLQPLTPSQLLLLKPNPCVPPGIFEERDQYVRRWYKQAQYLADVFWKRWLKEYLPTLQERQKWTTHKRNLKAGDLVLVVDERVPRGSWPLGQVMKTIADKEGDVRSVAVKTAGGYKYRPISKLCFLETDKSFESDEVQSNSKVDTGGEDFADSSKDIDSDSQVENDDTDIRDSTITSVNSVYTRPRRQVRKPERYKDFV